MTSLNFTEAGMRLLKIALDGLPHGQVRLLIDDIDAQLKAQFEKQDQKDLAPVEQ